MTNNTAQKIYVKEMVKAVLHQMKDEPTKFKYFIKDETNTLTDEQKKTILSIMREDVPFIEADNREDARDVAADLFADYFTTDQQAGETKEDKPAPAKKKVNNKRKKKETPEDKSPKEVPAPKEETTPKAEKKERYITKFEYYQTFSTCKVLPMSPSNQRAFDDMLKNFDAMHNILSRELEPAEMQTIKSTSASVDAIMNRTSVAILVEERDSKKKLVSRILLKPVYMSEYSILCVSQAHQLHQPEKTIYNDIVNMSDSDITCYDAFNFNPLNPLLVAGVENKAKNKITYTPVNVVAEKA